MDGTEGSWRKQVRKIQKNGESIRKGSIIVKEVMECWWKEIS